MTEYDYLTMQLKLPIAGVTQYLNYDFQGMTQFRDGYIGVNSDGIHSIDTSDADAGVDIDAFFELITTDFGLSNQKRLRKIYVGYETDGSIQLTVKDDDNNERTYVLLPTAEGASNAQHGGRIRGERDGKGRYWFFRIDNIDGSDFSVDAIDIIPVILARKPRGTA